MWKAKYEIERKMETKREREKNRTKLIYVRVSISETGFVMAPQKSNEMIVHTQKLLINYKESETKKKSNASSNQNTSERQ